MAKKIAYFVGNFPSKSETWIPREILELMNEEVDIKIFSIRDKRTSLSLPEYSTLLKNTEYRNNFFFIHFIKAPIKNLKIFFRILKEIWENLFSDTQGLRGKMQIIKDLIFFICQLEKIKNFNPDLIVVHFANARANHALFYNILTDKPYIIKMHATDVFRRPNLFQLKIEKAYKVLTISNYNISFIKNRDKDIDISKFMIHHCGIPIDNYVFKDIFTKNNNVPIILSVARLSPMKGFDTLIKASNELFKKDIKHKLIIVGFGPDKELLTDLVNKFGLQDIIEFRGYCSPEEIKNLLASADLFVLASKFDEEIKTQDGIPVAIMEAMSTGLPVITTKISGIPELIEDGVNGFLINPGEVIELANKIEEVLKMSKNDLQEIGTNARLKIEADFNLLKLTKELKEMIISIN